MAIDDGTAGLGAVLQTIRRHGPLTRADLGARTGLGRATVAQRLDALIERGLVKPLGEQASTGGRPAGTFAFDPGGAIVLAVDLGASHADLAVTDLEGRMLLESAGAIAIAEGPDVVLAHVERRLDALLARSGRDVGEVLAVGVDVPGPVAFATGRPVSPPIMPGWDGYDIAGRLAARFGARVIVDNDANAMALAEQVEYWPECDELLYAKVGTGVGCGIVAGGRVFRGGQGAAGEIGHIAVRGYDTPCVCGNSGCLEAVIGSAALVRRALSRGLDVTEPRAFDELVKRHDTTAMAIAREAGRLLGEVLAGLVNALNPTVVVLGGDLAGSEPFAAGVREIVHQRAAPLATQHLQIVPSRLGDRAGTRGTAIMAIEHALSPRELDREQPPAPAPA
ncbi:ROK family transcriptional regulator [Conexibacter stalactiti]|uniref:ROK family transcriptional regulator n=1 Tax=Conexibacter stalactiti TaxID=1940611 RepID=A0ABU4HSY4_9ACTN|nr:ROK family transcriptional regulator [Conexibacter stalactiti]MDW5596427.1 ROK family transcriptional regulator [Conexibacter stalactiti]MEC5037069.1 ROK family transcriptional regulator [Conexibacter stalactiti]